MCHKFAGSFFFNDANRLQSIRGESGNYVQDDWFVDYKRKWQDLAQTR